MVFGERLKWARLRRKLSQQELASLTGITKAAISRLEMGSSKSPSAENLFPIARALGVNPEWLVTGKGPRFPGHGEGRAALTPDEDALLNWFRRQPEEIRQALLKVLDISRD